MMQFSEAVDSFRQYLIYSDRSEATVDAYMKDLKYLQQHLQRQEPPVYLLNECTILYIESFLIQRKENGLSAATRARNLNTLHSFYKFCTKKEYIPKNIMEDFEPIKIPQKEREFLSPAEQESYAMPSSTRWLESLYLRYVIPDYESLNVPISK